MKMNATSKNWKLLSANESSFKAAWDIMSF